MLTTPPCGGEPIPVCVDRWYTHVTPVGFTSKAGERVHFFLLNQFFSPFLRVNLLICCNNMCASPRLGSGPIEKVLSACFSFCRDWTEFFQ